MYSYMPSLSESRYLCVIIWYDSVTIVSSISAEQYDFTKLRMWLQMWPFQWLTERVGIITGECKTPHWTLPISFWHLAHTLESTYCRSPACFQIFFPPLRLVPALPLSLLLISLLQIVEAKSENLLASWGELRCPTKFSNLLSQDAMDIICGFVTLKVH